MEINDKELLVCLSFEDKIDPSFFNRHNQHIFFKAINLDSQRPFIQIDRHVFQGTYEDCLGTNIFLEEMSEPRCMDNVFQTPTSMHLEYLNRSAKILNLKWINVPEDVKALNSSECIDLRFFEDYQSVLDKIENGSLDIQDAITNMQSQIPELEVKEPLKESTTEDSLERNSEAPKAGIVQVEKEPIVSPDLLKLLVEPETEQVCESPCGISKEDLFDIEHCDNFYILKQLYVNHLSKETAGCQKDTLKLASGKISSLVNLEESIKAGVITKFENIEDLSDLDKQALFNLRNFDNLSLPARFIVLTEYLSEQKKQLQKMSEEELNLVDKHNRRPKQRYKLLKSLARDIEYILLKQFSDKK